ncbi:MAG: leucine-rich repeat domain-containing protein [Clostridia bacterium]|nr:leucine-rich repeat domain-containing protein [Clostridia bacterium]
MKRKLLSLAICLIVLVGVLFSLASCDPREFEGVTFKDARYMYDGFEHTIAVEGAPKEANITYSSPNTQTEEGIYVITATISAEGYITKTLTATLTITGASNSSSNGDADAIENLLDFYPLPDGTYGVKMGKTQYLDKVEIPSTYNGKPVTKILMEGFSKSQATEIIIPNTINEIDDYAFVNCINLTSITIPDSVTSIGSFAFENCTSLTSVTIGNGVTSIGDWTFYKCTGLTSVYITDIAKWCAISFDSPESNPLYYADNLYLNGELVTNLVIPDGVTRISDYAFYKCKSLKSVTIGNGVTSIGSVAFYECTSLTSVTIGNGVTSIGSSAFGYCTGLTRVTIPDSVTSIDHFAFSSCTNLTSVTIPDSVTNINERAFSSCYKLVEVINHSLLNIVAGSSNYGDVAYYAIDVHQGESKIIKKDDYIFYTYNGVNYLVGYTGDDTELTLPESYNGENYEIYKYAFYECTSLTSVTIPDSVTRIGSYAFYNCTSLTSVTIGNGVTSIGSSAFEDCYKLVEVINISSLNIVAGSSYNGYVAYYAKEVHKGDSKIVNKDGYLFYTYNGVNYLLGYTRDDTELALPESYNGEKYEIYGRAFYNCDNLTSVTIGNGVTRIGYSAFSGCTSLTSVTIGNGVTSIGERAFYYCTSLTSIKYRGTQAQWNAITKGTDWIYNTGPYTITYNYTGE